MAEKSAEEIVEGLIKLQRNYSNTYRAIVTEERYNSLVKSGLLKDLDFESKEIREPLIEHVGNLPIVAAYLYEYIENKNKIDLGKVLVILSVHDIGETEVGDMFCFNKTKSHADSEVQVAKKLLSEEFYKYFEEYENGQSFEAKFARAVDKMAPLIHEIQMPEVTTKRFKIYNYNTEKIIEKRTSYFEWDKVLREMFNYIVEQFRKMES